jgi:hypothetical protein
MELETLWCVDAIVNRFGEFWRPKLAKIAFLQRRNPLNLPEIVIYILRD